MPVIYSSQYREMVLDQESIYFDFGSTESDEGSRSVTAAGRVSIPAIDTQAQIQRDVNARSDIEEHVAQLVYRVITGTVTARNINASPAGRLLLGRAVNAGWIKAPVNEKGNLELTDEVRESLRLS